jgi:phytanoyl-CoA hydroxylase
MSCYRGSCRPRAWRSSIRPPGQSLPPAPIRSSSKPISNIRVRLLRALPPRGETVRRLLDAYARNPTFAEWGTAPALREWMEAYFGESALMSRVHHNCMMTKHPLYGSLTGWHRDIRYWSFEREDLVSAWLALGDERSDNGALWLVPGSHRMAFGSDRFDESKFFRADRVDNAETIRTAVSPRLAAGDAVFFHCNTLHSAGKNLSDAVKFSLVYTYYGRSNAPRPGTRSASKPAVALSVRGQ